MDSVILFCSRAQAGSLLAKVPRNVDVEIMSPVRTILRRGNKVLHVERWEKLREEIGLDEQARETIMRCIPDPVPFTISYHDPEFCKEVVMAIGDREDIIIDNDFGVQLRGNEMVNEMRRRPGLDWRSGGAARAGGSA